MSNQDNNEGAANDADISTLPPKDQEETKAVIESLKKDGEANAQPSPEAGATVPPVEAKPQEPAKKPEDAEAGKPKPPEGAKKPEGEDRRDVSLIPAWQLKAAENKWNKEKADLEGKLTALSQSKPPVVEGAAKPDDKAQDDFNKKVEKFASENNLDPKVAHGLVSLASENQGKLPPDVAERLGKIDALQAERQVEIETIKFSSDFDKQILPLIKAEYGDDVPTETVDKIKEDLKGLAYSQDYAKVPYVSIYKGFDQFRGVIPQKKRGAEPSRGGSQVGIDAEADKPKTVKAMSDEEVMGLKDEDIDKLSDEDFDSFSDRKADLERKASQK